MRVPRTNAAVSKVHTLFNCCILGKVYFQPLKGRGWKTRRVCLTQTRLLTYARSAHQCSSFQSSHFVQLLHFREGLFSATERARLKNTSSLLCANLGIICARSAHECNSLQSWNFVRLLHFKEGKNMLTIRNVSKTYGRSAGKAVDNLSFEAKSGEIFGFLGPNGAGKTTTIKMITGVTIFYCNHGSF